MYVKFSFSLEWYPIILYSQKSCGCSIWCWSKEHFQKWKFNIPQPENTSLGTCNAFRGSKWWIVSVWKGWGKRITQMTWKMKGLTSRIQFIGFHSQVVPGMDFSVQFFLIIDAPLFGYSEELPSVTGLTDGVSVQEKEVMDFLVLCWFQSPQHDRERTSGLFPCVLPHTRSQCALYFHPERVGLHMHTWTGQCLTWMVWLFYNWMGVPETLPSRKSN